MAASLLVAACLQACSPGPGHSPAARAERIAPARPRIVSINPCVDGILREVADPSQIAGISHYSQDPRATSVPLDWARRFPATSGTAEEVVALAPDVVIAGGHVDPATIAALARLGVALVQVGVPETVDESLRQIATIAAAAGQPARGAALSRRIQAAVRHSRPADPARVPAIVWQGGGMVPGGQTLVGELLDRTGYRNLSHDYGLARWDVLPLERLVARPPRVLLSVGAGGREDRMLGHPVLAGVRDAMTVRLVPERLLHCGGPTIIDAVDRLASIRRTL